MSELLTQPIETKTVATKVQITAFVSNYEEGYMEVQYMTLQEDDTPYQRGNVRIEAEEEMAQVYIDVAAYMSDGDFIDVASGKVAYAKVLEALTS